MSDPTEQLWLLAIGTLLAGFGGWETYMSFQSRAWSKTTGKILERELKRGRDLLSVNVRILYSYDVDGYNFVSSSIRPGVEVGSHFALPFLGNEFFADSKFEKGNTIEVIFDPRRPRRSAIAPGNYVVPILTFIAGAATVIYWIFNYVI